MPRGYVSGRRRKEKPAPVRPGPVKTAPRLLAARRREETEDAAEESGRGAGASMAAGSGSAMNFTLRRRRWRSAHRSGASAPRRAGPQENFEVVMGSHHRRAAPRPAADDYPLPVLNIPHRIRPTWRCPTPRADFHRRHRGRPLRARAARDLRRRRSPRLPVRALQFAQGACKATGRAEAFERGARRGAAAAGAGCGSRDRRRGAREPVDPRARARPRGGAGQFRRRARGAAEAGSRAPGASRRSTRRAWTSSSCARCCSPSPRTCASCSSSSPSASCTCARITKADEAMRRAAGRQTLELFAPLANRLGVSEMKWELEDYAFRFNEPDVYKQIAQLLDEKRNDREAYIQRVIDDAARASWTPWASRRTIQGRPKHIYSIWRKMRGKSVPFEKLYDIRAVRVIVSNVRECYTVLGIVHDLWTPVEGEFDDYIANPKANDYRSLHTAVVGPEGQTLEVQIRTEDMHLHSEHGVAAHWRYKEGGEVRPQVRHQDRVAAPGARVEERAAGRGRGERPRAARASSRTRSTCSRRRARSWTCRRAPRRSISPTTCTPTSATAAAAPRSTAQMVPLDYKLQNAQRVEIMAAKQGGPSRDWLSPQLGLPREPARARQGAPVVPPRGLREGRGRRARGARQGAAAPRRHRRVPRQARGQVRASRSWRSSSRRSGAAR